MKAILTTLKWVGLVVAAVIAVFVAFVFARSGKTYETPYPAIQAVSDSSVVARGRHLVHGPAHCAGCHGLSEPGEPPAPGYMRLALPLGTLVAPNLTPDDETGIGTWSDGEIARALRYGVKHDDTALFDIMNFYDLSDEDLTAVVSYLRSLDPVQDDRGRTSWSFLGKAVEAMGMIRPMGDGDAPAAVEIDTTAAYGRYIAETVANCRGCHTNRDLKTGAYVGVDYAGGMEMELENSDRPGFMVTPNLTPDPETGILAGWTEDQFVGRFRSGHVIPESVMPWREFVRMNELELRALYRYLQSLDPVKADAPIPVGPQFTDA